MKFKVGQRIWFFDENRRRYRDGQAAPIIAEHYSSRFVLGVEGRSYLIGWSEDDRRPEKVAFAKAEARYLADAEKDDDVFIGTHRIRLADRVRVADAATLRRVAEVIGYDAGEE